jgi:hypothetical protein
LIHRTQPTPNYILKIFGGIILGVNGTSGSSGTSGGTGSSVKQVQLEHQALQEQVVELVVRVKVVVMVQVEHQYIWNKW